MPAVQLPLFCAPAPSPAIAARGVATTPELDALLALQPAVALNCSGGKDGACAALAAVRYLDMVGHRGPRLCVHADLGSVEWQDSLPMCRELADRLGLELLVVRRGKGGLMDRWRTRWSGNIARYCDLKCATLIMPWSSAKWRYCTSELKAAPIASALKRRFPNRPIINVTGIRRQESAARAAKAVVDVDKRLARKGYAGLVWHPVIEYRVEDVWATLNAAGMRPHVAYQIYNASRVSCTFCVLAKLADLQAGARCPDNHAVYVEMVELEAVSTFSFQSGRWLADVAPWLLDGDLRARVVLAKKTAQERERLEALIPAHLRFVQQLPKHMPTREEACLLAAVRRDIGQLLGLAVRYTTGDAVQARYAQLLRDGKRGLSVPCTDETSPHAAADLAEMSDTPVLQQLGFMLE